jgi:acetolactate synthase-1/2/3 large subunit
MAQIDVDPAVIGTIFPAELGLVADARSALAALVSLAGAADRPTHDWSSARATFEATARIPAARVTDRIDTSEVIAAMHQVLPHDVVVSNDAGNFASFLHRYWLYRHAFTQVAPCNGAMGYAVPGAIGAKLAAPHRSVVALAGDGGFTMTAMELETAVREQLDITVIVMRNGLQGTIAMHQARYDGRLAGVDIGNIEIADLARSLGAFGLKVSGTDDVAGALEQAYRTPGPAVLEVLTDPQLIAPTSVLGTVSR